MTNNTINTANKTNTTTTASEKNTTYVVDSIGLGMENWSNILDEIKPEDKAILCYTENQNLPIDVLSTILSKNIKVEPMKFRRSDTDGSVEFQISTELGYQIAQQKTDNYVLISNKPTYDPLVRYWTGKQVAISRRNTRGSVYDPTSEAKLVNPTSEAKLVEIPMADGIHLQYTPTAENIVNEAVSSAEKSTNGSTAAVIAEAKEVKPVKRGRWAKKAPKKAADIPTYGDEKTCINAYRTAIVQYAPSVSTDYIDMIAKIFYESFEGYSPKARTLVMSNKLIGEFGKATGKQIYAQVSEVFAVLKKTGPLPESLRPSNIETKAN